MPEGDTIWRQARALDSVLSGHVLAAADLRVPAHATAVLAGWFVPSVRAHGKHVLIDLSRSRDDQPSVALHTTLGMDGSWRVYESRARWSGGPGFAIRAVLKTESVACVGYRLPHVDLLKSTDEGKVVGHLGPDLLGADWDLDEARANLLQAPERGIGNALMDQRNLAGIGNVYKSELCFIARVNPATPVAEVENLDRLLSEAHRLLDLNKATWRRNTTGDARAPLWVYGRGSQSCRVCGSRICVNEQGRATQERLTWWCPTCQPQRD
jgi:endonuclease-8